MAMEAPLHPTPMQRPMMKGKIYVDASNKPTFQGIWGMTHGEVTKGGQTNDFKVVRMEAVRHDEMGMPVFAGHYLGYFKLTTNNITETINEEFTLKFRGHTNQGYNVYGYGSNRFGPNEIVGTVTQTGKMEIFKMLLGTSRQPDPDEASPPLPRPVNSRTVSPPPASASTPAFSFGSGGAASTPRVNGIKAKSAKHSGSGSKRKPSKMSKSSATPPPSKNGLPGTIVKCLKEGVQMLRRVDKLKYFHSPVLQTFMGVRGLYSDVIKKPMDLGTVLANIDNKYRTAAECIEDVRLVFSNAKLFNPDTDPVHASAASLSGKFETYVSNHSAILTAAASAGKGPRKVTNDESTNGDVIEGKSRNGNSESGIKMVGKKSSTGGSNSNSNSSSNSASASASASGGAGASASAAINSPVDRADRTADSGGGGSSSNIASEMPVLEGGGGGGGGAAAGAKEEEAEAREEEPTPLTLDDQDQLAMDVNDLFEMANANLSNERAQARVYALWSFAQAYISDKDRVIVDEGKRAEIEINAFTNRLQHQLREVVSFFMEDAKNDPKLEDQDNDHDNDHDQEQLEADTEAGKTEAQQSDMDEDEVDDAVDDGVSPSKRPRKGSKSEHSDSDNDSNSNMDEREAFQRKRSDSENPGSPKDSEIEIDLDEDDDDDDEEEEEVDGMKAGSEDGDGDEIDEQWSQAQREKRDMEERAKKKAADEKALEEERLKIQAERMKERVEEGIKLSRERAIAKAKVEAAEQEKKNREKKAKEDQIEAERNARDEKKDSVDLDQVRANSELMSLMDASVYDD